MLRLVGIHAGGKTVGIFCLLGRHTREKSEVYWDGEYYRARCKKCDRQIVRVRHNVWRRAKGRQVRAEEEALG